MLVLTRREGEQIRLGDDVVVTVVSIQGNKVRIGITAPGDVAIRRGELVFDAAEPSTVGCRLVEQV